MAEPEIEEDSSDSKPEEKKGAGSPGRSKTLLMAVGVGALLASNAFFIYRSLSAPAAVPPAQEQAADAESPSDSEAKKDAKAPKGKAKASDLLQTGAIFRLEPLLVNLADEGTNHFVRARVELVFSSKEEMERIKNSEVAAAKAHDVALSFLSSLRSSDLDEPEDRVLFRQELAKRLEESLGGTPIADVLLTDFIIQF